MRSVDLHAESTSRTQERAVDGKTSGLLDIGDIVTFEAKHFGVRQRLTVRITQCERPYLFEDVMVRGPFKALAHRHTFREERGGTMMVDDFCHASPLGMLGVLADRLFLDRYMRRFLRERMDYLKRAAEGGREA